MTSRILKLTTTTTRPADATAYAAGDEVSNSATPGSVIRPVFDLTGYRRGRILGLGVDVTPASSNVVITAFNVQGLLFKTADVPAAAGDNLTAPFTGAQMRNCIADLLLPALLLCRLSPNVSLNFFKKNRLAVFEQQIIEQIGKHFVSSEINAILI